MINNDTEKEKILYLCATPIGNLEDITYRAVRTLQEADIVAAEDTRHTRKLFARYDIHAKLVSYHEHNKHEQGEKIIEEILRGKKVVCVSDAGMPAISDPGADLARLAVQNGIRVSVLPGANAALSALVCSCIDATNFLFVGFLPATAKKRREKIEELKNFPYTLIFYEAPHHLLETLKNLLQILGNRRAAICREMTKKFEEIRRDFLREHIAHYETNSPVGEFVIVVEGGAGEIATGNFAPVATEDNLRNCCKSLAEEGLPIKEAMRETAKKYGVSRREVYAAMINDRE